MSRRKASEMKGARAKLPEMIRRYLKGTSVQVFAAEEGIDRRTIYRWMLSGLGDKEYSDLVTEALVNRIADADEGLARAKDGVEIGKYREMAKFARTDFERRRPALYGLKQTNVNIAAVIPDAGLLGTAAELLGMVARSAAPALPNTLTIEGDESAEGEEGEPD